MDHLHELAEMPDGSQEPSIWLQAGASLKEAQARAGHSSGALTLSIYGHVTPDAYATTTDRLDQMARAATQAPAGDPTTPAPAHL